MFQYILYGESDSVVAENGMRLALIDFLKGLVEFDPDKRWSPLQVIKTFFLSIIQAPPIVVHLLVLILLELTKT